MSKNPIYHALAVALLAVSNIALAVPIELNSGGPGVTVSGSGSGSGRGVSFHTTDSFSIDSIGFEADLSGGLFELVIWGSDDGHQVTTELAVVSNSFGDTSYGWNDVDFDFTFSANTYYAASYRMSGGNHLSTGIESLKYHYDSDLPHFISDLGITLIDGFEGYTGDNFSNSLHGSLRMNIAAEAVPEPSSLALLGLGLGLAGIGFSRKKKAA
ncbi:PEP-CTERM sorting domain-containing protein [Aliiglaciecola sp. SL4]|uniref:PEP-CTERM sorting domain-containing protein n=1 Tax=Aliiglaciecola sp. SL4 TaxID=3239806 RepID=UPI00355C86EA